MTYYYYALCETPIFTQTDTETETELLRRHLFLGTQLSKRLDPQCIPQFLFQQIDGFCLLFFFWFCDFQFPHIYQAFLYRTEAEAKGWCQNVTCPDVIKEVDSTSCCIHHVNIHSCPITNDVSYCGPWIPPDGNLYTHSGNNILCIISQEV